MNTGVYRRCREDVYTGIGEEGECTACLEILPAEHEENYDEKLYECIHSTNRRAGSRLRDSI
jgi:hypothetical protein